jgi:phage tail tape-measure protein
VNASAGVALSVTEVELENSTYTIGEGDAGVSRRAANAVAPVGAPSERPSVIDAATFAVGNVPATVTPVTPRVGSGTVTVVDDVTVPELARAVGDAVGTG